MIILYTNDCPRCKVLKAKLDQKNISYEINNDQGYMISIGIQSVPMLEIDGELLDFNEAIKWVNNK